MNIEKYRGETPGIGNVIHFNNAGSSLMPKPVFDTVTEYFTHELERGVNPPKTAITDGVNEDGISLATRFSSDASKNVVINSVRHALMARNLSTGIFFELDNYDVDIGNTITDGNGVQQFTIDTGRGYDLLSTDQFNLVELLTKI